MVRRVDQEKRWLNSQWRQMMRKRLSFRANWLQSFPITRSEEHITSIRCLWVDEVFLKYLQHLVVFEAQIKSKSQSMCLPQDWSAGDTWDDTWKKSMQLQRAESASISSADAHRCALRYTQRWGENQGNAWEPCSLNQSSPETSSEMPFISRSHPRQMAAPAPAAVQREVRVGRMSSVVG